MAIATQASLGNKRGEGAIHKYNAIQQHFIVHKRDICVKRVYNTIVIKKSEFPTNKCNYNYGRRIILECMQIHIRLHRI